MDLFGKKAAKKVSELQKKLDELGFTEYEQVKNAIAEGKEIIEKNNSAIEEQNQKLTQLHNAEDELSKEIATKLQKKLDELGFTEYEQVKNAISQNKEIIEKSSSIIEEKNQKLTQLQDTEEILSKQIATYSKRLNKLRELYKSVEHSINNFFNSSPTLEQCKLSYADSLEMDELSPSVILKLHAMDIKDLRKAFKDNDKQIEKVLSQYLKRYTTKANKTIYQLMVIAIRAEMQNILYNLKYEKLDTAIDQVKTVTSKYLAIVAEGNQSIAGTLTKFIGEIEYLFINAVKIEYNYYVKKEQARQEQLAIREQMRQEAAERKALEQEQKKIEAEELKYNNEIAKIKSQLESVVETEKDKLQKRILELESMLANVVIEKDKIANLQNGRAGNIYVISNLGSFGPEMFKVGMTRRINPQDRVDELGDASVPFRFDVHSFIFSEDAVSLEKKLHEILDSKRVNKVNLRKEFFYSTVDELEEIVHKVDPAAEFTKTMLAEEFRQSMSTDENYTTDFALQDFDEDE